MHIKQVLIEGFKSYKEQVATEEFSPAVNVVVGANGSGKSNFFHAIRFVLGDAYVNVRAEDRQQLLHEGAGLAVASAYVEVVFDNTDGRLPIDRPEVRLRRTIGAKKDEYTLDRKHTSAVASHYLFEPHTSAVASHYLFEPHTSAVASHSSLEPHTSAVASHHSLDPHTSAVAAHSSSEPHTSAVASHHSLEPLTSAVASPCCIVSMEEKLKELEGDRSELAEFQVLDRTRRCLEYSIFEREQTKARSELDKLERDAERVRLAAGQAAEAATAASAQLRALEKEMRAAVAERNAAAEAAEELRATSSGLQLSSARVGADVHDEEARAERAAAKVSEAADELKVLEKKVEAKLAAKAQVSTELAATRAKESELRAELASCEAQLQALFTKQGRKAQFANAAERDTHLGKEISSLQSTAGSNGAHLETMRKDTAAMNELLMELSQSIGDKEAAIRKADADVVECDKAYAAGKAAREALVSERRALGKAEDEADGRVKALAGRVRELEAAQRSSMAKDIAKGLEGVELLRREMPSLTGVYGPLIDLIECPQQLATAVDVTAGNQFFQVVVDDDDVALKLVRLMASRNLGRVTFMPLAQLRPHEPQYPGGFGDSVVPLVKKLKYDDRYHKAVCEVFGRTVLCRNIDIAREVGRSGQIDCVTLEGDQVARNGRMTGGFHDDSRSRMKLRAALREARVQLEEATAAKLRISETLAALAQADMRGAAGGGGGVDAPERLELARSRARAALKAVKDEARALKVQEADTREQLETQERQLASSASKLASLQARIATSKKELGTPLDSNLTEAEMQLLRSLQPQCQTLRTALEASASEVAAVTARLAALEAELSGHLLKRRRELERVIGKGEGATETQEEGSTLEVKRAELADLTSKLEDATAELAVAEGRLEAVAARLLDLGKRRDATAEAEGQKGAMVDLVAVA
ncbi:MAG: hypothetical protein WDW38_007368 [Sanguina aurantia]